MTDIKMGVSLSRIDKSKWETIRLGDVANIFRGGSPRPIQDYITTASNGINWIKIGDVRVGDKYIINTEEKIKPEGESKSRRVYPGDFLLSNSMSFGRPYILQIDGCIHDGWLTIQNYNKNFDLDFLYYLLSSDLIYEQYLENVAGSGVKNLNKESVSNLVLPCPDLAIQKQIAQGLDAIAKQIESLRRLIAKQEAIKKSTLKLLMTPKPEWKSTTIGQIADILSGGTPSTTVSSYWNGTIPWCTPTDITAMQGMFIEETARKITDAGVKHGANYLLPKGSLLLCTRATIGEVKIAKCHMTTNQGFKNLICHDGISTEYVYYLLGTLKDEMISKAIGSTFLEISKRTLSEIQIRLPLYTEQCCIAKSIMSLDRHAEELQADLVKALHIKQGMMRNFFGD